MARNQHTLAKRQREIEKKRKADEKRARRLNRDQVADDDRDAVAITGSVLTFQHSNVILNRWQDR